jgi:phage-related protein
METVEWVAPDGVTTVLDVEWAVTGRFMVPVAFEEDDVPGQPGARLRAVRHLPREFVLPCYVYGDTEAELRTEMRDLAAAMDPGRGAGKIKVTAPGGDQRKIRCSYAAGLEANETIGDDSGPQHQRFPIVFRAHDPYWYATSLTVAEFTAGARPNFFPFFPLRLSAGEVFADVTVDNPGDVATWPLWEIDGPGADIALRDLDHGQSTELATTLLAGQTVTVDTRPGAKTVVRDDGTNLFPALGDSDLWPLDPGATAVRIEMGGAGDSSVVRLRYLPAYLTA